MMAYAAKIALGSILLLVGGFLSVLVGGAIYSGVGATRGDGYAVSIGLAMTVLGLTVLIIP